MTTMAPMSSTIARVSRNTRTCDGSPGPIERERAQDERDVRRHDDAPAVRALATGVDGDVQQRRDHHPAEGGERRDRGRAAVAQLPQRELPADLQRDDVEEEHHQPVVDPVLQVLGDVRRADADRGLRVPQVDVGVLQRRVRPDEGDDRRQEQERRAPGLRVQELLQRPRDVARPAARVLLRAFHCESSRKRSASARKKSARVTMPVTRPSSTMGTTSTRWCRKISASWASDGSAPISTWSVVM